MGGTVTVTATAADDVGVTSVQFLLDGAPLGDAVSAAPYQVEWPRRRCDQRRAHVDRGGARRGRARDHGGRRHRECAQRLAAPTVALDESGRRGDGAAATSPSTATAVDDVGVTSVQFLLDGAPLGAADAEAPYRSRVVDDALSPTARTP